MFLPEYSKVLPFLSMTGMVMLLNIKKAFVILISYSRREAMK